MTSLTPSADPRRSAIVGTEVVEREFYHWASPEFVSAANNAATLEFTTSPTTSFYWRGKIASRTLDPRIKLPAQLERFAEQLAHLKYAAELLKEYVFEEVRVAEFVERPTRRRAMFLIDMCLDPHAYAASMQLRAHRLYRVTVHNGRLHRADASALNCNLSLHQDMAARARQYWTHAPAATTSGEVLFEGECKMEWVPPK